MADIKISALTSLAAGSIAADDVLPVVDVSDASMAASGTDKKIKIDALRLYRFVPPVNGDFAWINQDSANITQVGDRLVLTNVSNGATWGINLRKKAAPAAPYTITAAFIFNVAHGAAGGQAGLAFRQSSDGKIHAFLILADAASVYIGSRKFTNPTTLSADYTVTTSQALTAQTVIWMRLEDDGTNRKLWYSPDGNEWLQFGNSVGRTDFLTADEVGFFIDPYNAKVVMSLLSWEQN